MNSPTDGYHLIDDSTALRRGDTLHFGPLLTLLGKLTDEIGGRPLRLLDIGCGGGQLSRMLSAAGISHEYFGTDINHPLLSRAQTYYTSGARIVADAFEQPFCPKTFDVVTAYGIAFLLNDLFTFIGNTLTLATKLALININAPPPGVTTLRAHAQGEQFHWMSRTDFIREGLQRLNFPGPDHALGWETPVDGTQAIPSFRGPASRLQMTLIWSSALAQVVP